jgi:hypothetical protein
MKPFLEFCNYQNIEGTLFSIDLMKNNQNLVNNNNTASMHIVSCNRRLAVVIYDQNTKCLQKENSML